MTLSRKAKLIITAVVALPILLFAFFTWSSVTWTYSSGSRAGYVQKFSKQGWLCKTWEGELSMVAVPGSTPEKFYFTVKNDSIANLVNTTLGKRVALHYEQHKGVPMSCFGLTEYYVDSVRTVE
jgi:hypothetical protein